MSNRTCSVADCTTTMKPDQRLRKGLCPKHYMRLRNAGKPAAPPKVVKVGFCASCGEEFGRNAAHHIYCSAGCRWSAKEARIGLTCCICGDLMRFGSTSKPQGEAAHNACRTSVGGLRKHGRSGYRSGCRCEICRSDQAESMREYVAAVKAEHGVNPSTLIRRAFREANGYWPNRRGSDWVDPKVRFDIYERDGWQCHICSEPIDREAHWNDNFAPSLDHLIPRAAGGTHDPANLKTAHRVCNSVKGASLEFA